MSKNRVRLYILVGIVAAVIGPFVINELYKKGAGYVTMWDAKDMLNYYGMIVGSAVTIAGLIITIQFTRRQIQRESYLKSEGDKWAKTEAVVSDILTGINPMPILEQVMCTGFTDPDQAVFLLQKYQMACRSVTDQLCACLNSTDYARVKELVEHIADVAEKFFQVSQKEIDQYSKIRELKRRDITLKLLSMEEKYPGSLSAEEISTHQVTIQSTNDIHSEDIEKAMQQLNAEFIFIYETDFRGLLRLKGATFENISVQIQENADAILSLWRKK